MNCILVGNGYWGSILQKYISKSDFFEIVGIYTRSSVKCSFDDYLIVKNPQVVFICTPVLTHYELVKIALSRGCHVFCEKPLTLEIEKTMDLYKIAEEQGVQLFIDYIYLYSRSIKQIYKLKNEIGNISDIRMNMTQFGKLYSDISVMGSIGVHMLSVIAYLFDDIKISDVYRKSKYVKDYEFSQEEELGFQINETQINLFISNLSPRKERRIDVIGNNGYISFDMLSEQKVCFIKYDKFNLNNSIITTYDFDEANNLENALLAFNNQIINPNNCNKEINLSVERIIENVKCVEEVRNIVTD